MSEFNDSKALSIKRFNRFAPRYVTSATHAQGSELERLVGIVNPQPDWVMLDVATGGGHTALRFDPLVKRIVAMDITPAMLDVAKAFIIATGVKNAQISVNIIYLNVCRHGFYIQFVRTNGNIHI